jgi:hypothetical protein
MRLLNLIAMLSLVCGSSVGAQQLDRYGQPIGGSTPNSNPPASNAPLGPPPTTSGGNSGMSGGATQGSGGVSSSPPANTGGAGGQNPLRDFSNPGSGSTQPGAFGNDLPRAQPMNSGSSLPAIPPDSNRGYIPTPPNTYNSGPTYGASTAASNSGFSSGSATASTGYAESLMKASLTAPQGSRLTGTKLYLSDVVRAGGTRSEQSEAIGAYWDLCSAVADYYLSLHEQGEFERLASRSGQTTGPMREATKKLITRRDTSLVAAQASQHRLQSLMRQNESMSPPLPGDMPLCAVYHTRYSQNFPNGSSREASELNQLLPLRHAELLDAATNVKEAEDWFKEVAGRPTADEGVGMTKALELLALNRRAFVQIGRDYNKRIARYTELARPGQLQTERLVAMLIKTDPMASRTSAPVTPNLRNRSESDPPSTFQNVEANPLRSAEPRLDNEVLPTGGSTPVAEFIDPTQEQAIVERPNPGERSVLIRNEQLEGNEQP